MKHIALSVGTWQFDESKPLGPPGGFGEVFWGCDKDSRPVAVKRLHAAVTSQGSRELKIADFLLGHDYPHVIPLLDAGLDEASGQCFIVMGQANQSLQELVRSSAPLAESEAVEILDAIAAGLEEIRDLVHRDLKPGNILLHHGVWKLADLGLARFVEASTSSETMKGFLSPPYAAPEQWRNERSTKATDVYAAGCIIHALITGRPPFVGPTQADYRHQHEYESPPELPASDRLKQLAAHCLAKTPQLRPSVSSFREQLRRMRLMGGFQSRLLASAAAAVAEKQIEEEGQQALQRRLISERRATAAEAVQNLKAILLRMMDTIMADAPNATRVGEFSIQLGAGRLMADIAFPYLEVDELWWPRRDVSAGAIIKVQTIPSLAAREANLWFGKLIPEEGHRWWEVCYMFGPRYPKAAWDWEPIALDPVHRPLRSLTMIDSYRLAANPRLIDGEHLDSFNIRWSDLLALAALDQLKRPQRLPEEPIEPRFG